jgi:hypothetical protein
MRGGQLQVRRIDHLGHERSTARDLNGLRAMMCLVASGLSGAPRFCAAEVLRAWQFVTAVVDHIMARWSRHDHRPQFVDLHLHENCRHDQESFEDIRRDHDPEGNQAERGFSR